jgi:hypothetical protein
MIRQVTEGRLTQGEDERIAYTLTTTNWGASPGSPVCKFYDITDGDRTDVSATLLSGSASVNGDMITTPLVTKLTVGHLYRLEMQFVCSGNTFEAYAEIECEH